jgi:hypothetical protein
MNEDTTKKSDATRDGQTESPEYSIVTSDKIAGTKKGFFGLSRKTTLLVLIPALLVLLPWLGAYWVMNFKRTTAQNSGQVINALNESLSGGKISTKSGVKLPAYQPAGYSFSVKPVEADSIEYKFAKDKINKPYNKARRVLYLQGLEEKTIPDTQKNKNPGKYFISSRVQCTLYSQNVAQDTYLRVECANQAAYDDAAKQTTQFYDLYKANNPEGAQTMNLVQITEESSPTKGYRTASLLAVSKDGQKATPVFFYQTPDKTWHYFAATPVLIACSEYSNDDMKKAYFGSPCFSPDTDNGVVKL